MSGPSISESFHEFPSRRNSRSVSRRPVIVQHVVGIDGGGPLRQLELLMKTRLHEHFDMKVLSQSRATGGINIPLLMEMRREIRSYRPDLVHVRGLNSGGFYGALAARLAGCSRVLVSVHGISSDLDSMRPASWRRRLIVGAVMEPLTLRMSSGVYCVCDRTAANPMLKRHAPNLFGVIHNGIPVTSRSLDRQLLREAAGWTDSDMVALFVGRIVEEKGLLVLAQAMDILDSQGCDQPKLMIAGDGPDFRRIHRAFKPLIEKGRVKFLGNRSDIAELHEISDFFVFPTFMENLSNAIIEAMHAARAVLSTNVGGNSELVIHGVTGILIPPHSPEMLSQALSRFALDRALRNRYGAAGRLRIESNFSIEQNAEKLRQVYTDLLCRQ